VQANFSDPVLRGWVKALADPSGGDLVIRIGGGPQDSVVFAAGNYSWSSQVNKGGGCNASVFDYRMGDCVVLTPNRFEGMLDFCEAVGCKLVFGLSGMYGTCCIRYDDERVMYGTGHCEGINLSTCAWDSSRSTCKATGNRKCRPWDSSNAREILKHAHARQKAGKTGLLGFELGNELAAGGNSVSSDRTPTDMLANFKELADMITEIWFDTPVAERPRIAGPDNDFKWGVANASMVLESMAPYLHAFTYHKYGGGGETDARTFATYGSSDLGGIDKSVVEQYAPKAEVWLGEGGGAGCGEGDATHQQVHRALRASPYVSPPCTACTRSIAEQLSVRSYQDTPVRCIRTSSFPVRSTRG
jgi:hypothetical protein